VYGVEATQIGEVESWEFEFLDRQTLFQDLMPNVEKRLKKESNQLNPILCDSEDEGGQ
jgi:hypothetical protein